MAARLRRAGVPTIQAFEERELKRHEAAVAVVGVRQTSIEETGLASYLGCERGDSGALTEVYGRTMKLRLSVDVYAPREAGADGCEQAAETAAQALIAAQPDGLYIEAMEWGQTAWDKTCGLFLLPGTLRCTARFTAQADEDAAELRDFILRGVIRA